jgi:TIR domain
LTPFSVFISYSHQDEWLKKELVQHLSGLKRNGLIDLWHDRLIPAGAILDTDIDEKVQTSDIFLFLVSPAFLDSDYCMHKEYQIASHRNQLGNAVVIPVIIRDCDWDVAGLKKFNAVPKDGKPVTRGASNQGNGSERDEKWVEVIEGIKSAITALKKSLEVPKFLSTYSDSLFVVENIKHPNLPKFDERKIFVDPDLYYENGKEQVSKFQRLLSIIENSDGSIITGGDRSGKTLLSKMIHSYLNEKNIASILINGTTIRNSDIFYQLNSCRRLQLGSGDFDFSKTIIIIDDFDECNLPDSVKEKIVNDIYSKYHSLVIFSFSNAPSVLFTADHLPDPSVLNILPISNDKVLKIVQTWKSIGITDNNLVDDREMLLAYENIQTVYAQTEIEKSPDTTLTFLQLLGSMTGGDLAVTSFSACYEQWVNNTLDSNRVDWKNFDEAKNFLSLVAYTAYLENSGNCISNSEFERCLNIFCSVYLSSVEQLKKASVGVFLKQKNGNLSFSKEHFWYYFCARYASKNLSQDNPEQYYEFVKNCTKNIFLKKYANIAVFMAYFSNDNAVLTSLLLILDELFSKADDWILSDKSRSLMLGISSREELLLDPKSDVSENREVFLKEKVYSIIEDAEKVVAKYTLPFLSDQVADSEFVEGMNGKDIDSESYMKSVNALLRIHSVIGQILSSRSGTFPAKVMLDCIERMVRASGRYAYLNHAIATILLQDKEQSLLDVDKAIDNDSLSPEEKLHKVGRIFAFWSVYLSQVGLARHLSREHSIRALEILVEEKENFVCDIDLIPFNFTSVLIVSKLYHSGSINRDEVEDCIKKYGVDSALVALFRAAVNIYSHYMPITIEDKQWISGKLNISLKKIVQNTKKVRAATKPQRTRVDPK